MGLDGHGPGVNTGQAPSGHPPLEPRTVARLGFHERCIGASPEDAMQQVDAVAQRLGVSSLG